MSWIYLKIGYSLLVWDGYKMKSINHIQLLFSLMKVRSIFGLMRTAYILFIGVAHIRINNGCSPRRLIWAPYFPSSNQSFLKDLK